MRFDINKEKIMDNTINVNFKGGFWIKKPKVSKKVAVNDVWNEIQNIMPRHTQIIENFNEAGDKFYAIKTCYDKEIAYKLLQLKHSFKFYPDINLKSRLDGRFPKESMDVVNSQEKILVDRKGIDDFFAQSTVNYKSISDYKWYPTDYIDQTLKYLGLKKEDCKIDLKDSIAVISDKSGKVIAKASPNNHSGYNYVYVHSKYNDKTAQSHADDLSQMLCLNYKGEREARFAPDEFMKFYDLFMRNVKIGRGRKLPQG